MYRGEAVRYFPYSRYILYEGDLLGGFYAINHTVYKLFKVKKFTKIFNTSRELENYIKKLGCKQH